MSPGWALGLRQRRLLVVGPPARAFARAIAARHRRERPGGLRRGAPRVGLAFLHLFAARPPGFGPAPVTLRLAPCLALTVRRLAGADRRNAEARAGAGTTGRARGPGAAPVRRELSRASPARPLERRRAGAAAAGGPAWRHAAAPPVPRVFRRAAASGDVVPPHGAPAGRPDGRALGGAAAGAGPAPWASGSAWGARQAASAASGWPGHRPPTATPYAGDAAALHPAQLGRLTDEVLRTIDRRLDAYRDRRGRS